jgi:sec-independent protein translocase protein TatC
MNEESQPGRAPDREGGPPNDEPRPAASSSESGDLPQEASTQGAPGPSDPSASWPHRGPGDTRPRDDSSTTREGVEAYGPPHDDPRQTGEMPFLEHLAELRSVLIGSSIACVIGGVAGWWLAPRVLEDLIRRTVKHAILLSPLEAFNERIKMSLLIGLVLVLPYVFYRIWNFIVPGLLKRERSMILPMALGSMLLFAVGIYAAYGYVVPLIVDVLSQFQTPSMQAEIRLGALLGFFYNVALACGLVMQLPMVTMTLTALGIVTPGFLLRQWRYALVLVFLTTALITPGDVVTAQVIMGVPLTLLYFVSVGLSWLVMKRRARGETSIEGGEHA